MARRRNRNRRARALLPGGCGGSRVTDRAGRRLVRRRLDAPAVRPRPAARGARPPPRSRVAGRGVAVRSASQRAGVRRPRRTGRPRGAGRHRAPVDGALARYTQGGSVMCGIAGFAESARVTSPFHPDAGRALVHAMCDAIRHRGPDDEGLLVEDGVGIGMRRLSIIHLSTRHQPIHNEDRTVPFVFNGEIYNFRELRETLEAAGHHFSTNTDTEAIVHAYEQWGKAAIARLRGMFALAIWDRRRRSLLIARDRIGIKPLYYAEAAGRLYFGSELKTILCAPDVPRQLDPGVLDHYLSFLYTPRDRSIFRGIQKLPPGYLLEWRDGTAHLEQYWQVPADETFTGTEADAKAQLHDVLLDAVRSHLVSDVPLGAFLSGGVDSSVVVGLMAKAAGARVKTFSIGFDEPAFDELEHARAVARHFGTDHHEFVVKPDALSILDDLVSHFDEPFADSSAIPTWYVSQMARQHVTVVLSGDGGDELFGGYDRYVPHPRVLAFDRYSPRALRRGGGGGPPPAPP